MNGVSDQQSWSFPIRREDVPDTGRHIDLAADAPTRAAVAKLVGVREVARLEARFDVSHFGPDGLRVVGEVNATVGQNCVVTLEPLENDIRESIELIGVPPSATEEAAAADVPVADAETQLETLVDGALDLGAIATEFLLLGIDPYPRTPGVEFASPTAEDPGAHPFAALAGLKKGDGGTDS
jgi:uncharacterized metal-binding protein YceD (DUF177 family)